MAMKQRGLLLDRDGIINIDHGYVGRREQFQFTDGLFPFLRWAQDYGYRLAIITNQAGVARGYYSQQDYEALTQWMLGELAREGISMSSVQACFEHDAGSIPVYARQSFWRKPNPGMALDALQSLKLDPYRSVFIGDKISDMETAERAGIAGRLLLTAEAEPKTLPQGCYHIKNFAEAIDLMKKWRE